MLRDAFTDLGVFSIPLYGHKSVTSRASVPLKANLTQGAGTGKFNASGSS